MASSHLDDGPGNPTFLEQIEAFVDLVQSEGLGNEFIELEASLLVLIKTKLERWELE